MSADLVPLDLRRRDLLRAAGLAAAGGSLGVEAAQHVHQAAAEEKKAAGAYKPKFFHPHEFRTLEALTETTIPGARKAGAPEFIDLLCSGNDELGAIFTGGLLWMDQHMERKHRTSWVGAAPEQQRALLDSIAYKKNETEELAPGVLFFDWVRKMSADAYYTSPEGVKELGYLGNKGAPEFKVPEEAYEYALKRSGLG